MGQELKTATLDSMPASLPAGVGEETLTHSATSKLNYVALLVLFSSAYTSEGSDQ